MSKWKTVKLGDVVTLLNGRAYKQNELLNNGKYPVLRVGNFFSNRDWYYSNLELEEEKYCDNGDLLFAWSASFGPKIWSGKKVIYHYHIWKIITTDLISKEYLYYYLDNVAERVKAEGHGITMIHTTKGDMEGRYIPLPPLETQKQIAANLDKVTHTIDLCNNILEKLDLLVKARFVEMFGEPLSNPMNWDVKRLDEVAFLNKGITYSPDEVSDEGIVVLRSSNIKGNAFDLDDIVKITKKVNTDKYVHTNDILMCNRNGSARLVGKVAKIPELSENMTFGTFMTIVRSEIYEYLFVFFQLDAFREQIKFQTAVAINQISLPLLASVKVPLPPRELTDQFATFVEQTDKSKLAVKQVLEKAETLKKALMQEYFG